MSVHYGQLARDGPLQIDAMTAHLQFDSVAQQAAPAHWSHSRLTGQ